VTLQLSPNAIELKVAINPAQQMVGRNMIVEAEVVEQLRGAV
jgi:hypothetical protein